MFFRNKSKTSKSVGLYLAPNTVSIALVNSVGRQRPRLELLESVRHDGDHSQAETLAGLVKQHRLAGTSCNVVLNHLSYDLLQIEAPAVEAEELISAVRWQIKDLLEYSINDAIIDVFEVPHQAQSGRAKLVYVVAAHAPLIQALTDQVKASGLKLNAIDISEMAMRNLASLVSDNGIGTLYLSQTHSQLCLVQESNIYLARNLGANLNQISHIEESLTGAPALDTETPEYLERLILEIQRSFGHYESYFSQSPISELVVNPTSPELPAFIEYANTHLGIPVSTLDLNSLVECREPLAANLQAEGILPLGAALRVDEGKK